jgi:hypothetical protein
MRVSVLSSCGAAASVVQAGMLKSQDDNRGGTRRI